MIRNAVTLERERREYERTTKLEEKELQELLERKRRKPVLVRFLHLLLNALIVSVLCCIVACRQKYQDLLIGDMTQPFPFFPFAILIMCKQIQVQILTGRKIAIYIDPHYDQLIDIKKKIQIKEGIHPDQMILFYNGIRLQENSNKSLNDVLYISHHQQSDDDCDNKNNICLFLTLRNRGG